MNLVQLRKIQLRIRAKMLTLVRFMYATYSFLTQVYFVGRNTPAQPKRVVYGRKNIIECRLSEFLSFGRLLVCFLMRLDSF